MAEGKANDSTETHVEEMFLDCVAQQSVSVPEQSMVF